MLPSAPLLVARCSTYELYSKHRWLVPWTACVRRGFRSTLAGGVACTVPPVARGWALGMWAGSRLPLTWPPADQTWKSPPAYTPRKKVYSVNIDFPYIPFLQGTHTVWERSVRSPLFTPVLLSAAPAAHEVLLSMGTLWSPNSCLPFAQALFHAAVPSQVTAHRFSCAIRTPDTLRRVVSEPCHPTPIVMNRVSLLHWAGDLLVAANPALQHRQSIPSDRQHREHLLCHHGLSVALDGTRSWHLTNGQRIPPCQPEPALLQPGQGIQWETQHRAHEDIVIKCIYHLRDRNNLVFLLFQLAVWKSLCETDQICNYNTTEKIAGMSHRVSNAWRFMTIAYFCWVYSCKNSNES